MDTISEGGKKIIDMDSVECSWMNDGGHTLVKEWDRIIDREGGIDSRSDPVQCRLYNAVHALMIGESVSRWVRWDGDWVSV